MMDKEKLNIIIWGFGNGGKCLAEEIGNKYEYLKIVGFGDNNVKKVGSYYGNIKICGLEEIKENQENIDCVIIAVPKGDIEGLYQQLIEQLKIPIYKNISELVNKRFSIDITGWCNAKCKWCYTGRKNCTEKNQNRKYMRYEDFVRVHQHLIHSKIMHHFHEVMLYSWGEPFLNPDYLRIIDYLANEKQVFSISTNASYPQYTDNCVAYKNCMTMVFSLSGMSNESYKKIHGFDVEIIKENIRKIIDNMRQNGFHGRAVLSFHIYRFNWNEIKAAKEFAQKLNLLFEPIPAYLNGMSMQREYLTGKMSKKEIQEVEEELFMSQVADRISERPENYRCPLENIVSMDCDGNIGLCCCSDAGVDSFQWCSIFDITSLRQWQKYRAEMLDSRTCQECREYGIDYWICNPNYEISEIKM